MEVEVQLYTCTSLTTVQNSHSSDAVCRSLLTARRSASRTPSTPFRVLRRGPGEVLDIIYQGELAAWAPASAALPASFSAHFLHAFCTAALRCASGEWSWSDQLADLSMEVALRPQAAAAVPGTPVPRHACLDVQKTVLTWPCASILLMLTDGLHAASQAPTCVSAMHELAGGRS